MRKFREMSDKHIALGKFYGTRQHNRLAANMAEWNELHPEWSYKVVTNFGWDARESFRRVQDRYSHACANLALVRREANRAIQVAQEEANRWAVWQ